MLGRGARDLKLLCYNLLQAFHFCEDSFMNKNDPRYNHKMGPVIWKEQWRKGSQVCLVQHLATLKDLLQQLPRDLAYYNNFLEI